MRRLRLALILIVALAGILRLPALAAPAWSPPNDLRLIVALLPESSADQWLNTRSGTLHEITRNGATAVMNTRTARMASDRRREPKAAAVLTLSAGSRCASPSDRPEFVAGTAPVYPAVTAAALLQRRTLAAPAPGTMVSPAWASLINANAGAGYDISLGNLASSLTARGVAVRTDGAPWSNLFAANSRGEALVQPLDTLPATGRWMWAGELSAASLDVSLARMMKTARDWNALLLVVSPCASDSDYAREHRLTPIVLWGAGVPGGLLHSNSTRTSGLIANTDIAPTIASWFDVPLRGQVSGRTDALIPVAYADGPAKVAQIEQAAVSQRTAMKVLPYFALGLGLWFVLTLPFVSTKFPDAARTALCVLPCAAALALLLATSPVTAAILLPAGLAFVVVAALRSGSAKTVACVSLLTVMLVVADTVAGNPLMRSAVLGYSPIEGARYYGIGNEGMGVFLAAAVIVVDWLWTSSRSKGRIAAALLMVFAVVVLGKFGAKAGGIAVAIGMFGVYAYSAIGGRWNVARALTVPALAIAGLLLFATADAMLTRGSQAHLGVEMGRVAHSGLPEALSVITRKLAVELRLMWHSAWAVPLWLAIGILFWERRSAVSRATTNDTPFRQALISGACLTLALNDAGVVAAALMLSMTRAWTLSRVPAHAPTENWPAQ